MASASNHKVKCPKCRYFVNDNTNSVCCDDCDHWFHLKCSGLKLKEFKSLVKDSSSKFICNFCSNYKCGKCNKPVFDHQNGIGCDICNIWYHLKCSKHSLNDYVSMSKSEEAWVCTDCSTFPFASINNQVFLETVETSNQLEQYTLKTINPINGKTFSHKCSVCLRKIKSNKSHKALPCLSCYSLVHRNRKCSNIPLNDLLSIKVTDLKNWECQTCISDKIPFSYIDSSELLKMNFNSDFDCSCQRTCENSNSTFNFQRFNYSEILYGKNHKEHDFFGPDPENQTDKVFDFHPDFNYYTIHDFHKLTKKLPKKQKKSFSVFHSNICSLMHNFENLDILLKDLGDHKFDIVALSETWNPENKKITFRPGSLEGYHDYTGSTGHSLKGGCGLYVKNDLKILNRGDLDTSFCDDFNEFQGKWIEVVNKKSINILVGTYYRHPKKHLTIHLTANSKKLLLF